MEFKLPELGEGVYEAEMVRWLVAEGAAVKPGQPLVEVLTDKATMEVPAPFAGTIRSLQAREGDKLKIGQVILSYEALGKDKQEAAEIPGTTAPTSTQAAEKKTRPAAGAAAATKGNGATAAVKAAPSVRQLARKLGIDLATVQGSGPHGRVLVDDLLGNMQAPAKPHAEPSPRTAQDFGRPGTKVPLQGLRRKIAEHMVQSKQAPHYTYVDECDVTDLVTLRESLKEPFARKGVKLTYLPFIVKAVALALRDVPIVNAALDDKAEEIILHDKYHIGVAVASPGGLIVPVVRDADRLSILDIAKEIERLANDARLGKSKLDDLRGGTFTVTSIGNIGGLFATPILHHPQVGILGVGKIVKRPVFDERQQVRAADMVYLSFSFDHRVLDGAVGAAFGNAVKRYLQAPAALLVD